MVQWRNNDVHAGFGEVHVGSLLVGVVVHRHAVTREHVG